MSRSSDKINIERTKGFYFHNAEFKAALGRRHADNTVCRFPSNTALCIFL